MYADDTQITATAESVDKLENLLNKDIENLNIWLNANRLTANGTKTQFIIIASNYRLKHILGDSKKTMNQDVIRRIYKAKLLGVVINEDHLNEIIYQRY